MRKVIYNNDLAKIDNGLYFGRGVFETILVKEKPVFLEEHLKRLNKGIEELSIGEKVDKDEVFKFIEENNIKNKSLKIAITENNLIYTIRELKYNDKNYINGFKVRFSKVLRNSTSRIVNIKTLNYLENIIEYEISHKEGFDESIFLNENGHVCEGCTTNLFIVNNNKIFTPKVECGLLPGVIRNWIINNFDIIEKEITKEEVLNSDEIFLTNSLVGIVKVSSLNKKKFYISRVSDNIRSIYEGIVNGGILI